MRGAEDWGPELEGTRGGAGTGRKKDSLGPGWGQYNPPPTPPKRRAGYFLAPQTKSITSESLLSVRLCCQSCQLSHIICDSIASKCF